MRKRLISVCTVVILLCNIYGCTQAAEDTFGAETENVETEYEAAEDEPADDRLVDLTDYSSYLNKIWCMNGENLNPDNNVPISLVITQIEDGSIQGYFDDTPYVYTDYFWLPRFEEYIYEFYGTIYDGTAECRCDYKNGKEGTLTITFCGDDRIEAALDGKDAQHCLLRPYHISDVDYLHGKTMDFEAKLGIWGTVTIHSVNPFSRYSNPEVFLLNEQGDILYNISTFYSDSDILEIIIEDMDEDGLEDMKVITSEAYLLEGDWVAYQYERPFYQLENGQFVSRDRIMTEKSVEEAQVSFEGFEEMDYALFLETNVGCGLTLNYYRYGIYGDFVNTVREGEEVYFELCKMLLGTEISWKTSGDWAYGAGILHIQNLSPDLQCLVARQYFDGSAYGHYEDKAIYNGEVIAEAEDRIFNAETYFRLKKTEQGAYEFMSDEYLEKREQIVDELGGYTYIWALEDATCLDEYGKYLAISAPDSQSIGLYSTEDWGLRRRITIDGMDLDYPLAISQLAGDEESGFLVFSNGDTTYRLNYPDGQPEKIGEFMFDTTYSPDGKYLAYCTGNFELDELWTYMSDDESKLDKIYRMYDEWAQIPPGWYVREVETGNTTYIPVQISIGDPRPLYGGRCVWIEKDKLLQILNREVETDIPMPEEIEAVEKEYSQSKKEEESDKDFTITWDVVDYNVVDLHFNFEDDTVIDREIVAYDVSDIVYKDITGDDIDEALIYCDFANNTCDWQLIYFYQVDQENVTDISPSSKDIPELNNADWGIWNMWWIAAETMEGYSSPIYKLEDYYKEQGIVYVDETLYIGYRDGKWELVQDYRKKYD